MSNEMMKDRRKKDWFWASDYIFDMEIGEHAKIVYLYLCRCADSDNKCFPGYGNIAQKCSFSRDTAKKAIKELCEAGLIKKTIRKNDKNEYQSNLYEIFDPPKPNSEPEQEEGGGCSQHPGVGAHNTQVGAHNTQVGAHSTLKDNPLKDNLLKENNNASSNSKSKKPKYKKKNNNKADNDVVVKELNSIFSFITNKENKRFINKLLSQYKRDYIIKQLKYMMNYSHRHKIPNPEGFLSQALKEDYADTNNYLESKNTAGDFEDGPGAIKDASQKKYQGKYKDIYMN